MTGARFRTIADDVRERIALGDLGDSGALESEAVLGQRYGASRVTVRRALELLREQGLVESRQGSGWFVTGGSFHQTLALGTFRHAVVGGPESGRQLSRRVVVLRLRAARPPRWRRACGWRPAQEALHSRSVRTVDGVPLDLVQEWVPARARRPAQPCRRRRARHLADPAARRPPGRLGAAEHHRGRRQRPGRRAARRRPRHRAAARAPAALARDGDPLALSDHRYLAHRFSLEVEFHGWPTADEPPGLRTVPD